MFDGVKHHMGIEPKIVFFFSPQIIHLFIGFGTIIFTIHFGVPLFFETPILRGYMIYIYNNGYLDWALLKHYSSG